MKLQLTLLAAMLAAASITYAADNHPADAKAETPKAEKAEVVKKPVKKHSHAEEKTGIPASEAPRRKSHRESMPKGMPMHDHTQDRH